MHGGLGDLARRAQDQVSHNLGNDMINGSDDRPGSRRSEKLQTLFLDFFNSFSCNAFVDYFLVVRLLCGGAYYFTRWVPVSGTSEPVADIVISRPETAEPKFGSNASSRSTRHRGHLHRRGALGARGTPAGYLAAASIQVETQYLVADSALVNNVADALAVAGFTIRKLVFLCLCRT